MKSMVLVLQIDFYNEVIKWWSQLQTGSSNVAQG